MYDLIQRGSFLVSASCVRKPPPTGSTAILEVSLWCGLSLQSTSVVSEPRDADPKFTIYYICKKIIIIKKNLNSKGIIKKPNSKKHQFKTCLSLSSVFSWPRLYQHGRGSGGSGGTPRRPRGFTANSKLWACRWGWGCAKPPFWCLPPGGPQWAYVWSPQDKDGPEAKARYDPFFEFSTILV